MFFVSYYSWLFFIAGVGVASLAFLDSCSNAAVAQTSNTPAQMHLGEKTLSQVNALFVNPGIGDDKNGTGSENTPLKTITEALRKANPDTVIVLAKGTYSTETGEKFPLILKPGITIQGDVGGKGRDVIITGGGDYLSRSFGSKNVAIVSAKKVQLTGVTVTNSSPRGYGLWIESSNLIVTDNTFTGSTQDGIAVTGNATPIIRNNFFYRNGANGITITGTSRAEIRENIFQETGFGVNVADKAEPIVVGNQIQNNRSGMIVQASSRPIVRNNIIEGNKEDGLVAIAQAQPDLGNASEAGGNEFRNNGRYDINASAAKQIIAAYGNTIASDRIAGTVDTKGTAAIARNSQPNSFANNTAQEVQVGQEITFSAPSVSDANLQPQTLTSTRKSSVPNSSARSRTSAIYTNNSRQSNRQLVQLQPAKSPLATSTTNKPKQPTSRKAKAFPIPSSLTARQTTTGWQQANTSNTPQVNYMQVNTNTVEFVAPQSQPSSNPVVATPVKTQRNQKQSLPTLEPAALGEPTLLSVPNANIPLGNTANMRKLPVPENAPITAYAGSPVPQQAGELSTGLRYRVIAAVQTEREQELIRFLAPGAFPTFWQGQAVMQAGVFSTRFNAEQILKVLNNNGLRAAIEPIGN